MIKSERELTAAFRRHVRQCPLTKSCAIEFKFIKGKRLNFKSHFKPQQLPALLQAKQHCYYDKISDMSAGLKPFDAFNVCGSAYAAIMFAGDTKLYFVAPEKLIKTAEKQKSITAEETAVLSEYFIFL